MACCVRFGTMEEATLMEVLPLIYDKLDEGYNFYIVYSKSFEKDARRALEIYKALIVNGAAKIANIDTDLEMLALWLAISKATGIAPLVFFIKKENNTYSVCAYEDVALRRGIASTVSEDMILEELNKLKGGE